MSNDTSDITITLTAEEVRAFLRYCLDSETGLPVRAADDTQEAARRVWLAGMQALGYSADTND